MYSSETISNIIADAVASVKYPENPRGLYEPIAYTLESGGKRLRPQFVIAVGSALGVDAEHTLNAALGIEIFHNFTLLHDDVMDDADLRRGRLTVHKRWNENTAILSGDAMLTLATMFISKTASTVMPEVLQLFNQTAMEVYEGQQFDMDYEKRTDVTVAEYLEMIRLKTSVLIGCACKMGAIIAGASTEVADSFYNYGINLGLAFQLRDDLLDTYGDPLIFGKQIGGDIINEKKTWLLINAMAERHEELCDILAEDLDDDERVRQVREVYDSLKLKERCGKLIEQYAREAVDSLSTVQLDEDAKAYFIKIAEDSIERTY